MSDCNVCLYADGDMAELFFKKDVTARKPWKCVECNKDIPVGAKHQLAKMLYEHEWSTYRTCLICAEIRAAFYCDGELYECFWEQFDEVIDEVTTGCLKRLTTPEAKAYLMQRVYERKLEKRT